VVEPGRRADLNVIDLDRLTIGAPELRHDLPAGASRILQSAHGYVATVVDGEITRRRRHRHRTPGPVASSAATPDGVARWVPAVPRGPVPLDPFERT
jgi:N-acyl-D-aspartate/D-glutamate deacylase